MAEDIQIQAPPPLPPKGPVVTEQSLYLVETTLYRNSLAFGGSRNPTSIWEAMTYNLPWSMGYYRELEEKDEDVANCLDSLKLSVQKRKSTVSPANDKDSQAVDTKEFIEQQLASVDLDGVLDCVLDAAGYGFSVQEIQYDVSAGQASLLRIDDCPQELFLFGNRFRPQIGNLRYLENPFASDGVEQPEEKFLITSYRPRAGNRMGRPLLKGVFWPSWFKRNMQRLWVQFAEKGPGTAVVRYNDANNQEDKRRAAEIAQAIINSVAVGVPKDFEIETELLKVARAQDPAVYENFFQAMQYAIARRVLGETLTSFGGEGGKGTQALGNVHGDTFDQRSVSVCRRVEWVINRQLIRPLVIWNFGPEAPMPTWELDKEQKQDLLQRINIDATAQRMGKKIPVGYMASTYSIPLAQGENAEDPNDVLEPNAAAPNVAITDQARASFSEKKKTLTRETHQLMEAIRASSADEASKDSMLQLTMRRHEAAFAELSAEVQAHREMGEFDQLFDELRQDSLGVFKNRVAEIAGAAIPIVKAE